MCHALDPAAPACLGTGIMKIPKQRSNRTPKTAPAAVIKELNASAQSVPDMRTIAIRIINEDADLRQKIRREAAYSQIYQLHLLEEVKYLLTECPEEYEADDTILPILEQLTSCGVFLAAFLEWAIKHDSVDVTDMERTADTLRQFCRSWKNK